MIIVRTLSQVQNLVDQHGVADVVTLLAPGTPHEAPKGVDPARQPPSSISTTSPAPWTATCPPAPATPRN